MNRNQLIAFTIAYETRNLVRTADRLYVSQSAVSQQLKKLEDELHTELFVHKKGQIVPNEYGDLFYPYAKEALAALARGEETLHRRQQADQNLVIYLYSYFLQWQFGHLPGRADFSTDPCRPAAGSAAALPAGRVSSDGAGAVFFQ